MEKSVLFLAFIFLSLSCQGQISGSEVKTDSIIRIAFLQLPSKPDQQWNLNKGEEYCRKAAEMGADIAMFPEMINIGYTSVDFEKPAALDKWKSMAISENGAFVNQFKTLARDLNMAIVITYLEKTDDLPKNTASLIDRHGNIVLSYSKVHTVDPFPMESAVRPGKDFYVTDLDTKLGPVRTGIMICYDREFPESARILMLKGAELILTPNACGLDTLRLMQFRVRAWENSLVTAMTNYASSPEDDGYNGRSCMFSADGSEILIAGEKEGVYIGEFDLKEVREYRSWTYWGNSYRRPHKYKELISPEVNEPFFRKNGFGKEFKRMER